ncbi:dynamin family protein [Acinetobacter rudis]|uniref:Dynamin family protein n=1 Tax=Acinetobacter rudis TaxID=632955 RepID=A0AAW8JEZ4_9GAMM|nr:dynamin family protein [Acinetobacter rudis]MDQ8936249.1 dynamin family protein [Acinetobacter rudis]MDQ9018512.1 dynamin family protein [Acinetobacter rudis]
MGHQVEILREEAQTLLKLEQNLLLEMAEKGILDQSDQESDQDQATLDTQSVKKEIAVLRGEELKVTELEMVLAVVGTMKAGKSTTINAIVGTEILPNRNAPMTAIPTLIKHCKGKKQPHLIFTDMASRPVNQLMQDLRMAFQDQQHESELEKLKSDKDLFLTVERIQKGANVVNEALGEKQIFDFLVSINDLVRIAPLFDMQFPFGQYQEIDQLPVIEVEFAHLQEMEDQEGKLILLDTPGPNEAGQAHLRPMLQDQLKKASAVLAVMDYTQLKSEADAQVRDDLKDIANTVKNRIYALVNKFDNCDRNGMQQDEVKTFVEGLTDDLIKQQSVYPVAAKFAYLANRARHERLADGSLPDTENATWVEDFYQEAGLRRESHRTPGRVAEAIEDLWEDSKFSHPLKEVIEASHQKAAFVALDSAVDKLDECSEKINIVLSVKEQALHKTVQELQSVILQLEQDIQIIDGVELNAIESVEMLKNKLAENINEFINKQYAFVEKNIIDLTLEGNAISVQIEEQKQKQEQDELKKKQISYKLKKLFKVQKTESEVLMDQIIPKVYDSINKVIDFGQDGDAAKKFLDRTSALLPKVDTLINQEVELQLDILLQEFEKKFSDEIVKQALETIQQINNSLNESGFEDIRLELPNRKTLSLKLSGSKLMHNALIEESHKATRSRVVNSKWGRFKNWLNDNWGTETYTEIVREYKVDMSQVEKQIINELKENQKLLNLSLVQNIEKPLADATKQFFSAFKRKVSGLRKDIEISLSDKEQSKQHDDQFLNMISSMKKSCQDVKGRTQVIKDIVAKNM